MLIQMRGLHPTQKPVKLFEWIITKYSQENGVICDPFMGSGSSMVAAIKLGHKFIGFEKEPIYFNGAQERIEYIIKQGKLNGWFK